jgi:hypothetical protein
MFRVEEYSSAPNILLHNTNIYRTNMPHILENRNPHNYCGENLKFHNSSDVDSNENVTDLQDNDSMEDRNSMEIIKCVTMSRKLGDSPTDCDVFGELLGNKFWGTIKLETNH